MPLCLVPIWKCRLDSATGGVVSTGGDLFQWQGAWRGISKAHGQIPPTAVVTRGQHSIFTSLTVCSMPSKDILINTGLTLYILIQEEISSSGAYCWLSGLWVLVLEMYWAGICSDFCCRSFPTFSPSQPPTVIRAALIQILVISRTRSSPTILEINFLAFWWLDEMLGPFLLV